MQAFRNYMFTSFYCSEMALYFSILLDSEQ